MKNNTHIKRRISLVVFIMTMVLCGCESGRTDSNPKPNISPSQSSTYKPEGVSISIESVTTTSVYITEDSLEQFQKTLAETDIVFAYEECFGIETMEASCGVEKEALYESFREHAVLHQKEDGSLQCNASFGWLSEEERQYVFSRAVSDTVEYTVPICIII